MNWIGFSVTPIYVPSANHSQSNSQHNHLATNDKQQFIITLDGIENTGFISKLSAETLLRYSICTLVERVNLTEINL